MLAVQAETLEFDQDATFLEAFEALKHTKTHQGTLMARIPLCLAYISMRLPLRRACSASLMAFWISGYMALMALSTSRLPSSAEALCG